MSSSEYGFLFLSSFSIPYEVGDARLPELRLGIVGFDGIIPSLKLIL